MSIRKVLFSLFAASALSFVAGAHASNIALGQPVSLTQGTVAGGSLSSLTDGVFAGFETAFDSSSTVHWFTANAPVFELNLGGLYSISSLQLEHDHNDVYLVFYPQGSGVGVSSIFSPASFGMKTSTITFSSPVTASKLTFMGVGGDGAYALSEIQVTGVAVIPEPGSYGMMLAGLALMGGVIARRRSSKPAA